MSLINIDKFITAKQNIDKFITNTTLIPSKFLSKKIKFYNNELAKKVLLLRLFHLA